MLLLTEIRKFTLRIIIYTFECQKNRVNEIIFKDWVNCVL